MRSNTVFVLCLFLFGETALYSALFLLLPPTVPGTISTTRDILFVYVGLGIVSFQYWLLNRPDYATTSARPLGIVLLAIQNAVIGAVLLFEGALLLFLPVMGIIGLAIAGLAVGLFKFAQGLYEGKDWALTIMKVLTFVGMLSGIILGMTVSSLSFGAIPLSVFQLWYLYRPNVSTFFELGSPNEQDNPALRTVPKTKLGSRTTFSRGDVSRAFILSIVLFGSLFLAVNLNYATSPPKAFTYSESVPSNGSSISLFGITGAIHVTTWDQSHVLINGTVVVSGEGALPDNVQLLEQDVGGMITFHPNFNDTTVGRNYMVYANLFLPNGTSFADIELDALGGGSVQIDSINASSIGVTTLDGNIGATMIPAPLGSYALRSDQGGTISLKIPATSSFTLKADQTDSNSQTTILGFDNRCTIQGGPLAGTYPTAYIGTTTMYCGNGNAAQIGVVTAGNISVQSV